MMNCYMTRKRYKTPAMKAIAEHIRRLESSGVMSKKEIAERLGYADQSSISRILSGAQTELPIEKRRILARMLGVSLEELETLPGETRSLNLRSTDRVSHIYDPQGDELTIKVNISAFRPVIATSTEARWREVPIISKIAAGKPIQAIENYTGELLLDPQYFKGENLFALRVEGISMVPDGILDGDIAILRKQNHADDGDIVAALIEDKGEVTLKRIYRQNSVIELRPANDRKTSLKVASEEIKILGKMVGLVRRV